MKEQFNLFLTTKGITAEDFAKKEVSEIASLYNEFNDIQRKEMNALIEAKASQEDIQKAVDTLRASQLEQMNVLNEAMKELGLSIKASTEKGGKNKVSFNESLRQGLEARKDSLAKLKGEDLEGVKAGEFSFKTAGDITSSNNISGGNVPVEQRLAGFNTIASRRIRLFDLVARGNASSNIISWVYQANKDGSAGQTTEGTTKNQIDFDLVVASESVKKTTAYIKISTEMLDDVDFIESEIRNELLREVLKKVELGIYSGAGTTNTLHGIKTVSTAFAPGTFATGSANEVINPNQVDVLTVAKNQIALAEQDEPTAILMNPTDVTALLTLKVSSTDKRYVERLQLVAGQLSLDGTPIIKTTLVTAGTYLVGDFSRALLIEKGGLQINIGLDGNDWTKNMRTILAEWRGAMVVKNNDRTAFVTGTFATDIASIAKA
jgi:HK97 family phage major capsid protein